MILRAMLISGLVLVFFSGCSEATKVTVVPKSVKVPQKYQLKVVRVDKKLVQDSDVFSVDFQTLKKISKLKSAKKLSSEDRVLEILKKLKIKESLNLKTINYNIKSAKQTKDEIVVIGHSYYAYSNDRDGYVLYFDKDTLDIKRATIFRNRQVLDISNNTKKVLVSKVKSKQKYIETYNFDTGKFTSIEKTKNEIIDLKFSPKGSYVVVVGGFKVYGKRNARLSVYNSKTFEKLLGETLQSGNDSSVKFIFTFSPDEKYLFTSEHGYTTQYSKANLYATRNFKSVLNFFEDKKGKSSYGWGNFMLTNDYLIFIDKNEIYSLKTKKVIDKIYFGFSSPNIMDKKDNNLFYGIGTEKIGIYYIKDEKTYLIKSFTKEEDFTKVAFVYKNRFYLFPSYESRFQIIDIPNLDIKKYNFELVKQLKQAKKFYDAGFKTKSLAMYKKMMINKDFNKYFKLPKYRANIAIYCTINLQKYKQNKDIDSLGAYIRDALRYDYINEATKALNELKKVEKKESYVMLNAMYLAQIGKEEKAYDDLVERMPFSQKIVDLIYSNRNSSLKFYKDKAKISLIFGIDESEINYNEQKKRVDFVSFDGYLMDTKSKIKQKVETKKVVTPKQNAIKLLD